MGKPSGQWQLYYIFGILHIAAIVLRVYSKYMVVVNYFETPKLFIMICLMIIIVYNLRKVLKWLVVYRSFRYHNGLFGDRLFFLCSNFKFVIRPFLRRVGARSGVAWGIATYPLGVDHLLMIFPYLNEQNKLARTTYLGWLPWILLF